MTLNTYGNKDSSEKKTSNIIRYLEHGMSDKIEAHNTYLARNRNPWYVVDRRVPPPVLVTYMSRGKARFIRNETDARNLNNLHGMYIDVDLDEEQLNALLAYLNSEFASKVVRRSGRTYSSGMDKIEPNEMEGVPVLDPRRLDDELVSKMARLFDRLRTVEYGDSTDIESVIAEIDKTLQSVLQNK